MAQTFKHDETTLDPRDKHLVSYNKETKRFVCESSDLRGAGIDPEFRRDVLFTGYILWVYSPLFDRCILYRENKAKQVRDGEGELIADVFTPHFSSIASDMERRMMEASLGTELHILND
jgi:hypothetical protein